MAPPFDCGEVALDAVTPRVVLHNSTVPRSCRTSSVHGLSRVEVRRMERHSGPHASHP